MVVVIGDGGSRFAIEGAGGRGRSQAGGEDSEGGGKSHRDVKVPLSICIRIFESIRYR